MVKMTKDLRGACCLMFEAETTTKTATTTTTTTTTTTIAQKMRGKAAKAAMAAKAPMAGRQKKTDWNFFGNLPVISMFAEEAQ